MKKSIIVDPIVSLETNSSYCRCLENIIDDGVFDVIEIWDTLDENILSLINLYSKYVEFDVSLSPLLRKQNMDLSYKNLFSSNLISLVNSRIEKLSEIGIKNVSFSSPFFYQGVSRTIQTNKFLCSLLNICEKAEQLGVSVSFESFDISVDKKRLLGKTSEILWFFETFKQYCANLFLTWDLGHICLEDKEYLRSLKMLDIYIKRIHISNYSLDCSKWYFGDKHLPFGMLGDVQEQDIQNVIDYVKKLNDVSVAFEVSANLFLKDFDSFEKTYQYIKALYSMYF